MIFLSGSNNCPYPRYRHEKNRIRNPSLSTYLPTTLFILSLEAVYTTYDKSFKYVYVWDVAFVGSWRIFCRCDCRIIGASNDVLTRDTVPR